MVRKMAGVSIMAWKKKREMGALSMMASVNSICLKSSERISWKTSTTAHTSKRQSEGVGNGVSGYSRYRWILAGPAGSATVVGVSSSSGHAPDAHTVPNGSFSSAILGRGVVFLGYVQVVGISVMGKVLARYR